MIYVALSKSFPDFVTYIAVTTDRDCLPAGVLSVPGLIVYDPEHFTIEQAALAYAKDHDLKENYLVVFNTEQRTDDTTVEELEAGSFTRKIYLRE